MESCSVTIAQQSLQANHSKRVDEQNFFRLVQFLAVALFECNEEEDFGPARKLMNMCFVFYLEGEPLTQL